MKVGKKLIVKVWRIEIFFFEICVIQAIFPMKNPLQYLVEIIFFTWKFDKMSPNRKTLVGIAQGNQLDKWKYFHIRPQFTGYEGPLSTGWVIKVSLKCP
jgi:hypothetical protein